MENEKKLQCGTGEMGTLYWSKDAELDKIPEMHMVPRIDDGVLDHFAKGEWRPNHFEAIQLALELQAARGKDAEDRQSPPETDSSRTPEMGKQTYRPHRN